MRTVTGELFHTRIGEMLVYNEQEEAFSVGERISYGGLPYIIKRIVFPSKPKAKWSLLLVSDRDSPQQG